MAAGLASPAAAADPDVVVVGAGVAGIAAARALQTAAKNVLVIEARDRAGVSSWTRAWASTSTWAGR